MAPALERKEEAQKGSGARSISKSRAWPFDADAGKWRGVGKRGAEILRPSLNMNLKMNGGALQKKKTTVRTPPKKREKTVIFGGA